MNDAQLLAVLRAVAVVSYASEDFRIEMDCAGELLERGEDASACLAGLVRRVASVRPTGEWL